MYAHHVFAVPMKARRGTASQELELQVVLTNGSAMKILNFPNNLDHI